MKRISMHPGQILKKLYIDPQNLSISELSSMLGMKPSAVSRLIKGQHSFTSELSLKLAHIFQTTPEFWLSLQMNYDQSETSRGTDDPFYKLMKISGDAMLKLIGIQSNDDYEPRAIVLKEKRLYPDIVAFPKNKDREIIMIEFQGYKEPMMQYMMASKIIMMCTQENYTGPILGAIVYTDEACKKASLPFAINSQSGRFWIKGQFIEIDLSRYSEKDLIDIDKQLIILAPFTLPKNFPKDEYIRKCREWKKQIDLNYSQKTVKEIINILSLFILDRQRNMNRKEVQTMFNFDISQTLVGKELLEEGEKKGEIKGEIKGEKKGEKKAATKLIAKLMAKKFNISIRNILPRLYPLRTNDIMDLGENILSMNTFEEAYQWINNRKKLVRVGA
ncbi:MAG: HigA family addiction module antidote protein [Candidatus Magnetomorum sp.]|nr:HigA family addiction module antidote protein [Candidatus Magnetomorum sp.]